MHPIREHVKTYCEENHQPKDDHDVQLESPLAKPDCSGVSGASVPGCPSHIKTHYPPTPACPPDRPPTRPPYRPSEERAGPCVQNESALFVVLFRARAVSSSPLEMARAELTLIISDPGERRALSLHTIKAAELPWRTCFSVNRGSQSTHTQKK